MGVLGSVRVSSDALAEFKEAGRVGERFVASGCPWSRCVGDSCKGGLWFAVYDSA